MARHRSTFVARRICSTLVTTRAVINRVDCRLSLLSSSTSYNLSQSTHHPSLVRGYSSSNNIPHCNHDDVINGNTLLDSKGEECYQRAMDALKNASIAKQKQEEHLLKEQFDAMERQRRRTQQREQQRQMQRQKEDPRLQRLNNDMQTDTKDRAAGVALVRKIVQQSNAAVQVEQWNNNNDSSGQTSNITTNNTPINNTTDTTNKGEEYWQQIAQKHMQDAAFRYGHPLALVRLGNDALDMAKNGNNDNSKSTISIPLPDDGGRCESPINFLEYKAINNDATSMALYLYNEAGKQGSKEGWYNLGHLLWENSNALDEVDSYEAKEKAMYAFHKAIQLGDAADAIYFVAAQYLSYDEEDQDEEEKSFLSNVYKQYGQEVIKSLNTTTSGRREEDTFVENDIQSGQSTNNLHQNGYRLLCHAAHVHDHGPALHHLALLHNQRNDIEVFHRLLNKAADMDNPESLFLLGHCRYFGSDGYSQNLSVALDYFLAAADHKHTNAMISAGAMLHQGVFSDDGQTVIIERDQQRAFDLYQQAGELGSIEGWRNVVSCYATGQGVPKCLDTAKYIANTMLKEEEEQEDHI